MTRGRWFLPETPDLLGQLRGQLGVTIEGLEALARWAAGDAEAAEAVREAEKRGDAAKRELLSSLRAAFVAPLEPEDLFMLSRGIDRILTYARDLVTESEVMSSPPDSGLADMATLLVQAVRQIDDALRVLDSDQAAATDSADAALETERQLEATYYRGMASLLDLEDRQERIARRELYRRCTRIGELVVDVAERVVYSVVKES